MKLTLSLNPATFDHIGMGEASLMFTDFSELEVGNSTLSFQIWGLDIGLDFLTPYIEGLAVDTSKWDENELYLAGPATMTFADPKEVRYDREKIIFGEPTNDTTFYVVGGVIGNYFTEFDVLAGQHITLTFDTNDLITANDYIFDTKRYTYKG